MTLMTAALVLSGCSGNTGESAQSADDSPAPAGSDASGDPVQLVVIGDSLIDTAGPRYATLMLSTVGACRSRVNCPPQAWTSRP